MMTTKEDTARAQVAEGIRDILVNKCHQYMTILKGDPVLNITSPCGALISCYGTIIRLDFSDFNEEDFYDIDCAISYYIDDILQQVIDQITTQLHYNEIGDFLALNTIATSLYELRSPIVSIRLRHLFAKFEEAGIDVKLNFNANAGTIDFRFRYSDIETRITTSNSYQHQEMIMLPEDTFYKYVCDKFLEQVESSLGGDNVA